jgi:hypothetical protein
MKVACPVLNGGDEETGLDRPRLVATQLIDIVMHIALECPIAAGRVRLQPTARVDGEVRRLLHGLHGEILGRLHDDSSLATDPRDDRRPIFGIMAPTRLAFLAATTRAATPKTSSRRGALGPSGQLCDTAHPLRLCPLTGAPSHRTGRHCAATSTSDSSCGSAPPPLWRCAETSRRGRAERSPKSSAAATACFDGARCW